MNDALQDVACNCLNFEKLKNEGLEVCRVRDTVGNPLGHALAVDEHIHPELQG